MAICAKTLERDIVEIVMMIAIIYLKNFYVLLINKNEVI
jgi:hypothetical protein